MKLAIDQSEILSREGLIESFSGLDLEPVVSIGVHILIHQPKLPLSGEEEGPFYVPKKGQFMDTSRLQLGSPGEPGKLTIIVFFHFIIIFTRLNSGPRRVEGGRRSRSKIHPSIWKKL